MGYYDSNPNRAEHARHYKPQNTNGGCCAGSNNTCNEPSKAPKDSPLWEWEQIYGKLITVFRPEMDKNGHKYSVIERVTCPLEDKNPREPSCCSVKYKVAR